jgi:hypothetical protein
MNIQKQSKSCGLSQFTIICFCLGFLILLNLPSSAIACDVIDSGFLSIGELVSENVESQIGNPRSLIRLIGPPVKDSDIDSDAKMLHLRTNTEKNQLIVSKILPMGELGESITWGVSCDAGRWQIESEGKSSVDGAYQKYSSKIWLNTSADGNLEIEHHYRNVSGLIFRDYYYYESKIKFKKQ